MSIEVAPPHDYAEPLIELRRLLVRFEEFAARGDWKIAGPLADMAVERALAIAAAVPRGSFGQVLDK